MKIISLIFIASLLVSSQVRASCSLVIKVDSAISASTSDYIERAEKRALEQKCDSIFLKLNTPGGDLQSTRQIVEMILASRLPYLCLITPSGGHAGSAGAILLQACHVNGGLAATNVGAATPILGTGEDAPPDLRKKMINDVVSWLESVTRLRDRNLKFSKEIVTEAKAVSSQVAVAEKALDIFAESELEFLEKAQGRKVLLGGKREALVTVGELQEFLPDLRHDILSFVADPEFAYLLLMGSLALLYVEITHPGLIAPGVIGGIGLTLSLIAFHKLQVVWGGLVLLLLGILFLILEVFVPSFGALGVGGLISLFVGSVFLFDTEATGYSLPLSLISSVVGVLAVVFFGIGYLALKTLRLKVRDVDTDLMSHEGVVISIEAEGFSGQIEIHGEVWNYLSKEALQVSDRVHVTSRQELVVHVKKSIKE